MAHYTYIGELIPDPNWQKFATAVLLGGAFLYIGRRLSRRLKGGEDVEGYIVPSQRFTLLAFVDFLVEGFVKYHDSIVGKEHREYASFTGTIFFFLLAANLLGLIPGMAAITTTVWINVGIAAVVFIYFNYLGIKHNGLAGYVKHFCGPIWLLAPLIFPVEVISTCLRVLTLNLRLYWNIAADHMVLGGFVEQVWWPTGIPFYLVGTFVSFMQAFIFTTLTMVYILLAVQHEEEH